MLRRVALCWAVLSDAALALRNCAQLRAQLTYPTAAPNRRTSELTNIRSDSAMLFDLDNPVMQLCAAGMEVDGEPTKALALFEQAWNARSDDFDASVAAHFVARHQPTLHATLDWNERALRHAELVTDDRAVALLPSLCLNLAESYRLDGRFDHAEALVHRGLVALDKLSSDDGYAQFVRAGFERLLQRLRDAR